MTIKLPVEAVFVPMAGHTYVRDATGRDLSPAEIAAALNATPPAPNVTAVVNRILDTLEQQGVALWGCFTDEDADACRADAAQVITPVVASLTAAPDPTALHEAAAASVSQPDAGPLPVETTASAALRPQEITVALPTGCQITFTARQGAMGYDLYHDGYITTVLSDGTILGTRRALATEMVEVVPPEPSDWRPGPTTVLGDMTSETDAAALALSPQDGDA